MLCIELDPEYGSFPVETRENVMPFHLQNRQQSENWYICGGLAHCNFTPEMLADIQPRESAPNGQFTLVQRSLIVWMHDYFYASNGQSAFACMGTGAERLRT